MLQLYNRRTDAEKAIRFGAVLLLLLTELRTQNTQAATTRRHLDTSYRPPPIWGCESGLPAGAFHIVVATLAPEVSGEVRLQHRVRCFSALHCFPLSMLRLAKALQRLLPGFMSSFRPPHPH